MLNQRSRIALIYSMAGAIFGTLLLLSNIAGAEPRAMDLVITGLLDGPLPGGQPKVVELYVVNDVADLSVYGFGSANNGGGTDGEEFTLPADSATAGDFIYITANITDFVTFFGTTPTLIYETGAVLINGDDAVELFENGTVIDTFGQIDVDGSGEAWEHTDGWAYRQSGTTADGATFDINNWLFSGVNALDDTTSNSTFPIGSYDPSGTPIIVTQVTQAPTAVPTTPAPTAVPGTPIPTTGSVIISELDADTPGTDVGEYIELFTTTPSNVLDAYCLVLFNGSSSQGGAVYESFDLAGYTTDASGFFIFGDTEAMSTSSTGWLQNGADGVAVVEKSAGECPVVSTDNATTVCAGYTVAFGVHYGTNDDPSAALSCLGTYVDEDANGNKDNESLQILSGTFCTSAPTPGDANVCGVSPTAVPTTPSATSTPSATATPIATILPTGDVAINELDADTEGSDVNEFVELFGTLNNDLGGYCLVLFNGNAAGDVYESYDLIGYMTDADGFFVFGDTEAGGTGWLQNGADGVAVVEKIGGATCPTDGTDTAATVCSDYTIASSLHYGTNDPASADLACLGSIVDEDINGSGDTESLQVDADGSICASPPTPGMANVCVAQPTPEPSPTPDPNVTPEPTDVPVVVGAGTGDVVINEIMANPANLGDSEGEWFELYNPGAADFDLNDCVLSDLGSNTHTISGTVSVPAMGYLVLGSDSISATAPIDYEYSSFQLSNGDDELLITCADVLIDAVAYDTASGWTIPAGSSIQLNAVTADNLIATNWLASTNTWAGSVDFGTPGQMNDTNVVVPPTAITFNSVNVSTMVVGLLSVMTISLLVLATAVITKRN